MFEYVVKHERSIQKEGATKGEQRDCEERSVCAHADSEREKEREPLETLKLGGNTFGFNYRQAERYSCPIRTAAAKPIKPADAI